MSIQTKLEIASFNAKKKLYDNLIRLKGIEVKGIRIQAVVDRFGDDQSVDILSDNEFISYIDILNTEIPLNRYRLDQYATTADSQSLYLFEVIPIDLYVKWADTMEAGDLIILLLKDLDADLEMPVVFRVSDMVGRFQKSLLHKVYKIAPYNPSNIEPEIRTKILEYIAAN